MNVLSEDQANEFAQWYRCLSDGTRVRVLHAVAGAGRPLTVGEVVDLIGKSQSTISRHLRILAESRFIFMEPDGVRTLVRINELCLTDLPAAAEIIMGRREAGDS